MSRPSKNPEERRAEFITAAEEIFLEKGFENTSVDDIAARVGVAKGLFYYYFSSKEELLAALAERYLDEIQSSINKAMDEEGLTALQMLQKLSPSEVVISDRSKEIMKLFHNERNQAFHLAMEARAQKFMVPALERVVAKGCEEGIFHTDYQHETAVALVAMFNALKRSAKMENDPRQWNRFSAVSREIMERVLDAEPGTFSEFLTDLPPKNGCQSQSDRTV
jgi:AcrR family transcriptional regulator